MVTMDSLGVKCERKTGKFQCKIGVATEGTPQNPSGIINMDVGKFDQVIGLGGRTSVHTIKNKGSFVTIIGEDLKCNITKTGRRERILKCWENEPE